MAEEEKEEMIDKIKRYSMYLIAFGAAVAGGFVAYRAIHSAGVVVGEKLTFNVNDLEEVVKGNRPISCFKSRRYTHRGKSKYRIKI